MSCTCIGLVSWIQIWHPFSFNHYASSTWYIITRTVHPGLVSCSFYAIPLSPPFIFYSFGLDGISNVTCATFVRPSAILCCFCRSTSLCLIHEKGTSSTCCPIYMCFPLKACTTRVLSIYPLLFPPLCFVAARVAEHCGMDLRTIVSDIDPKHLQVLLICRARVCILLLWKDFWHTLQCRSNCALRKAADPGVGCAMARDGYFVAAVA